MLNPRQKVYSQKFSNAFSNKADPTDACAAEMPFVFAIVHKASGTPLFVATTAFQRANIPAE